MALMQLAHALQEVREEEDVFLQVQARQLARVELADHFTNIIVGAKQVAALQVNHVGRILTLLQNTFDFAQQGGLADAADAQDGMIGIGVGQDAC